MKNNVVVGHFRNQADVCRAMGSPFTASLCEHLIDVLDNSTKSGNRIENWPGDAAADALALRLCGALHAIAITNVDDELAAIYREGSPVEFSDVVANAIQENDDMICGFVDLPPQTNETGRAGALLPGLLEISRHSGLPIHLCEIGASAGLNLQLDGFHCDYAGLTWGNPDSPVKLRPKMKAKQPDLPGELDIVSRIGCDISPVDIDDPNERLRLRAFVWPDQKERTQRLNGAIALARLKPPEIIKQDAADFVEQQLAGRPKNTAFVLMHSVVWQYLPQATKERIEKSLQQHGSAATRDNPIYWLRLEGFGGVEPAAGLLLARWPEQTDIRLANSCFHGSWIEFL